ncbi:Scaffold-type E3 ligase [Perkinsus chesapeaki]|uniref:Scaffold-type E3 ligase n=1 Tax=Perkinsus chesapeaki TaxID=330153 RepID=A0A7J6N4B1_PERCH|nr:Scaffold-type E3 ligase [Perkinsus chesapeaki]
MSLRGLSARQSALVSDFADVSGTGEQIACSYLQRSNWSLEGALDMFYQDGAPGACEANDRSDTDSDGRHYRSHRSLNKKFKIESTLTLGSGPASWLLPDSLGFAMGRGWVSGLGTRGPYTMFNPPTKRVKRSAARGAAQSRETPDKRDHRLLRRKVNNTKLGRFFSNYATSEGSEGQEAIGIDGIERLCGDLGNDPMDEAWLTIAFYCQAETMGEFTKSEWLNGMQRIGVDSMEGLRDALPELRKEIDEDRSTSEQIYRYAFTYSLDSGAKTLPIEGCMQLWSIFLKPYWSLYPQWEQFVKDECRHNVSKDTYQMLWEASTGAMRDEATLRSDYDISGGAWPVMLDDFYTWFVDPGRKDGSSFMSTDWCSVVLAGASAFGCAAVAVGGGIGALYMPAFVALMGDAHWAVPLSKVAINGVAVSATIFNIGQRHPIYDQPLIDLDVGLLMEPATLVGAMLGVYLNVIMTSVQILTCLVLVLSATAILALRKAIQRREQEGDIVVDGGMTELRLLGVAAGIPSSMPLMLEVDKIVHEESVFQPLKAWALFVVWLANGALLYLAEGPAELLCGDTAQKAMISTVILLCVLVTIVVRERLLQRQLIKDEACLPKTSVVYTKANTIIYPFLSCFAGVCAGCLGIGGGLIKGPLMLQLGMLPQAATATSIWMILFTSSSTSLQFALMGRLLLLPSVAVWVLSFSGAWVGSRLLVTRLHRSGRQSTVAFLMAALILLSMLCMVGVFIYEHSQGTAGGGLRSKSDLTPSEVCELMRRRGPI